jgi:hypothetical protein
MALQTGRGGDGLPAQEKGIHEYHKNEKQHAATLNQEPALH